MLNCFLKDFAEKETDSWCMQVPRVALLLAATVTFCKSHITCKVGLMVSALQIYFIKEQNVHAVKSFIL